VGSSHTQPFVPPEPPINFSSILPTHIPRDSDDARFVQSFSLNGGEESLRLIDVFFETYGFVVIRDVLNQEQLDNSLADIWRVIEGTDSATADTTSMIRATSSFIAADRSDPLTWTPNNGYPSMEQVGILGGQVAVQASAFENRQNENLYRVFAHLLGQKQLLVSLDRFGVIRPTKQVLLKDGITRQDFPQYVTREKWMHWDMNPFKLLLSQEEKDKCIKEKSGADNLIATNPDSFFITENNETLHTFRKLQGFIALGDATESDGGFICVPSFHKHIEEWARANSEYYATKFAARDFVSVPENDPLCDQGVKVPVRAGSLVIWDSRLPHCNFPNDSDKFRYVQYVKMFPKRKNAPTFNQCREMFIKEMLGKSNFQPSELGNKLFGLQEWSEED